MTTVRVERLLLRMDYERGKINEQDYARKLAELEVLEVKEREALIRAKTICLPSGEPPWSAQN